MRHPRSCRPASIANKPTEIQIVDTHIALEPRINIGIAADHIQANRTLLITIVPSERIEFLLRGFQGRELMHFQALFAQPVGRLDRGVVRRRSATAEVQDDGIPVRPEINGSADELRAVVPMEEEVTVRQVLL
jgi:hypothetical protein